MEPFRDDRVALRSQIDALHGELRARGPTRAAIVDELDALRGEVRSTLARVDRDRARLAELEMWIAALRHRAVAQRRPQAVPRRRRATLVAAVGAVAAVGVLAAVGGSVLAWRRSNERAAAPTPQSAPATTSRVDAPSPPPPTLPVERYVPGDRVDPMVVEGDAARRVGHDWRLIALHGRGIDPEGYLMLDRDDSLLELVFQRAGAQRTVWVTAAGMIVGPPIRADEVRSDGAPLPCSISRTVRAAAWHPPPPATHHLLAWYATTPRVLFLDGRAMSC